MSAHHVIAVVLLVTGTVLQALACLGVALMRDPLDRLPYLGPSSVAGVLFAAAILVQEGFSLIGDTALLLAVFLLISSPVLTHITAHAVACGRARRGD